MMAINGMWMQKDYRVLAGVVLLLLAAVASAVQQTGFDQAEQEQHFNSAWNQLEDDGRSWWQTGASAVGSFSIFSSTSQGSCQDPWSGSTAQVPFALETLQNSILAMALVTFALALLYMFGQLMQSPKMIATVKEELFQLLMMGLQVMAIFTVIGGANMFYALNVHTDMLRNGIPGVPGSADPDAAALYTSNPVIIDAAMAYSRLMIFRITTDLTSLSFFNAIVHTLYSATLWFGVTWRAMWSFNLGPALKPIIDILGSVMQYLGVALGEWILHLVMLCLIKKWTWGLFIPAGMLLYMIPHTRSAGVALIAIMFSLSLVYPLMFVANYEIYRMTSRAFVDDRTLVTQFFHTSGLSGTGLFAVAMVFVMAGVVMPLFAGAAVSIVFELVKSSIYYIVIISLLLPFLNIFVTLTAAREIAKVFGVNVNFMAFMRVI